MTNNTVNPNGEPQPDPGDLEQVNIDAVFYNADEPTFESQAVLEHIERQSRTSGNIQLYGDFDIRRVNYMRQYGLRFSFHNYTAYDIVVVDRLNLPVTIKPDKRHPEPPAVSGTFLIRKEMYFDNEEVAQRAYKNVLSLGKLQGREISNLLPELGKQLRWNQYGRCLALEYSLSQEEIQAGDGRLYHLPTDTVISFLSAVDTIRHPCSPEFTQDLNHAYLPNYSLGEKDVRVVYRYISADVKAPPKYLRLGKFIFMLEPETGEPARLGRDVRGKDKSLVEVELTEYIEVLYPAHHDATRKGVKGWRCHRMTLVQARESGEIFDTLEDARNPIQAAEREKQRHKDDIATASARHAEEKRALELKLLGEQDETRKLRDTVEGLRRAREVQLEKIREANEQATYRRKLSAENIKLIATLATAAVTLGGLYAKYKSSTTT